jgi:hypothetical protein
MWVKLESNNNMRVKCETEEQVISLTREEEKVNVYD